MKVLQTTTTILLLLPATLLAQAEPDAVLRDFLPTGDFQLELDGVVLPDAELYKSETAAGSILVVSDDLPKAVLLTPRAATVQELPRIHLIRRADGGVDVAADAVLTEAGRFAVTEAGVQFQVNRRRVTLGERPPLLGLATRDDLVAYSADYARQAAEYDPSDPIVRRLREENEPVRVRVFFGSWCPFCKQMVPRILAVEEALAGSAVTIEYFGLPHQVSADPEAARMGITGVPTGVVFRGDQELGRISGRDWRIPELSISEILKGE